jgi:hypothetical protein
MVGFFETQYFWQGGFTEEQQNYYEEHCLSQKGKHLWEQINRLYIIARNVCSTYNVTYCFDRSCCCRRYKHLPFQCEYNDDVTISSYINGNYDFYDLEKIEQFIAWNGAFELAYLLENTNDAPYKYEDYDILKFCFDNYKEENGYIIKYLNRCSTTEETNALKEPMEEEIVETGSSLDEKEEESDDQEEEEWSYLIASVVMMKMTDQLGTPRGRYDEHSGKFSSVRNQGFIVQEKVNTPEGDVC